MKAAFGRWEDRATFTLDVAESKVVNGIAVYVTVTKLQKPQKVSKWMFWKKPPKNESITTCIGFIRENDTLIDILKKELKRYIDEDYDDIKTALDGNSILKLLNIIDPIDKIQQYKELISKL